MSSASPLFRHRFLCLTLVTVLSLPLFARAQSLPTDGERGSASFASTLPALEALPRHADIIARWKLDEVSGMREDSVGVNDLQDQNTVGSADGQFGVKAADFEMGNAEYLDVADAAQSGLDTDGNVTFSFWLKAEDAQSGTDIRSLIYKYAGSEDRSYFLYHILEAGRHEFDFGFNSTGRAGGDGHAHLLYVMPVGEWFHVVITHDAANGGATVLYINGVEQGRASTGKTSVYDGRAAFKLGSNDAGGANWDGLMQDVILWGEPLSSQDVGALYASYQGDAGTGEVDVNEEQSEETEPPPPVLPTPPSAGALPSLETLPRHVDIISRWKLDEISGMREDSVGVNDLQDQNTVGSADGQFGRKAADFEKDNAEYLDVADAAQSGLDLDGNVTFSFWLKSENAQSGTDIRSLVYKYAGAADRSYALYHIQEGGIHEFDLILNSTGKSGGDGHAHLPFIMPVGEWFHATITHDATNGGAAVLYINGVEQARATTGKTSVYNGAADFKLGSDNGGGANWDGLMQDVILWKKPLSVQDVAALYASYQENAGGGGEPVGEEPADGTEPPPSAPEEKILAEEREPFYVEMRGTRMFEHEPVTMNGSAIRIEGVLRMLQFDWTTFTLRNSYGEDLVYFGVSTYGSIRVINLVTGQEDTKSVGLGQGAYRLERGDGVIMRGPYPDGAAYPFVIDVSDTEAVLQLNGQEVRVPVDLRNETINAHWIESRYMGWFDTYKAVAITDPSRDPDEGVEEDFGSGVAEEHRIVHDVFEAEEGVFDGSRVLDLGSRHDLELQEFSLAAWLSLGADNGGREQTIMALQAQSHAGSDLSGMWLGVSADGKLKLTASSGQLEWNIGPAVRSGVPVQLTITKKGPLFTLYLNGKKADEATLSSVDIDYETDSPHHTSIGGLYRHDDGDFDQRFTGRIRAYSVFDMALTPEEIAQLADVPFVPEEKNTADPAMISFQKPMERSSGLADVLFTSVGTMTSSMRFATSQDGAYLESTGENAALVFPPNADILVNGAYVSPGPLTQHHIRVYGKRADGSVALIHEEYKPSAGEIGWYIPEDIVGVSQIVVGNVPSKYAGRQPNGSIRSLRILTNRENQSATADTRPWESISLPQCFSNDTEANVFLDTLERMRAQFAKTIPNPYLINLSGVLFVLEMDNPEYFDIEAEIDRRMANFQGSYHDEMEQRSYLRNLLTTNRGYVMEEIENNIKKHTNNVGVILSEFSSALQRYQGDAQQAATYIETELFADSKPARMHRGDVGIQEPPLFSYMPVSVRAIVDLGKRHTGDLEALGAFINEARARANVLCENDLRNFLEDIKQNDGWLDWFDSIPSEAQRAFRMAYKDGLYWTGEKPEEEKFFGKYLVALLERNEAADASILATRFSSDYVDAIIRLKEVSPRQVGNGCYEKSDASGSFMYCAQSINFEDHALADPDLDGCFLAVESPVGFCTEHGDIPAQNEVTGRPIAAVEIEAEGIAALLSEMPSQEEIEFSLTWAATEYGVIPEGASYAMALQALNLSADDVKQVISKLIQNTRLEDAISQVKNMPPEQVKEFLTLKIKNMFVGAIGDLAMRKIEGAPSERTLFEKVNKLVTKFLGVQTLKRVFLMSARRANTLVTIIDLLTRSLPLQPGENDPHLAYLNGKVMLMRWSHFLVREDVEARDVDGLQHIYYDSVAYYQELESGRHISAAEREILTALLDEFYDEIWSILNSPSAT